MDFLDELESHILPGDGDLGTLLLDADSGFQGCPEELCLSQPELVASLHAQYIAAGARVIKTNSLGANAVRLEQHGLANRVNELNWTAARLARDAAKGKPVYVAGCVGPLGDTPDNLDRAILYQEQIGALLDGGAQLIFFAAFLDFDDLALALEIKESLHHCPAIGSLACTPGGRLASGISLGQAFARLREVGAAIVGVEGSPEPPYGLAELLNAPPSDGLLAAYPAAGDLTAAEFATAARSLVAQGARLIGGGPGTRPEHIAALAEAVRS
jgi:homocysteine S-methyltransferase